MASLRGRNVARTAGFFALLAAAYTMHQNDQEGRDIGDDLPEMVVAGLAFGAGWHLFMGAVT